MRRSKERALLADRIDGLKQRRRDLALAEDALERARDIRNEARDAMDRRDVSRSGQITSIVEGLLAGVGGAAVLDRQATVIDQDGLKERYARALAAFDDLRGRIAEHQQDIQVGELYVSDAGKAVFRAEVSVSKQIEQMRASFATLLPTLSVLKFCALQGLVSDAEAAAVKSALDEMARSLRGVWSGEFLHPAAEPWRGAVAGMRQNPDQPIPRIP